MTRFSKFIEESRPEGDREIIMQRINRLIAVCRYGDVGNESASAEGKNQDFSDTDDVINADDDDDDDNDVMDDGDDDDDDDDDDGDGMDVDDDIMDDSDHNGSNDGSAITDHDDDNIGADDRHFRHEPGHSQHWIQQPDLYEKFQFNPTPGNSLFQTSPNEQ